MKCGIYTDNVYNQAHMFSYPAFPTNVQGNIANPFKNLMQTKFMKFVDLTYFHWQASKTDLFKCEYQYQQQDVPQISFTIVLQNKDSEDGCYPKKISLIFASSFQDKGSKDGHYPKKKKVLETLSPIAVEFPFRY